jgi:ATP-dependent DNA helicase RecG
MSESPYYSISLDTEIKFLKGVGPARGNAFREIGIDTIKDLIYHFPRRYLDRTTVKKINELRVGDTAVIVGKVETFGLKQTKKRKYFQMIVSDDTGMLTCSWFNSVSWIIDKFKPGESIAIYGKVEFYNGLQIIHPEFDLLDDGEDPINTGQIIALYPSTSNLKSVGLYSRNIRKLILTIFRKLEKPIHDFYTPEFQQEEGLISLDESLKQIHFPENISALKSARYRLKFDEHFFLQLLMALKRQKALTTTGRIFSEQGPYVKEIYNSLSFALTDAQIRVLQEIRQDFSSVKPMNRLIQGDVGSGKTIVAMLASAVIIGNKAQVAVMAPTEILAEQHFNSFKQYCNKVNIRCELLTGKIKKPDKEKIYSDLKNGEIQLIVGTHALIQDPVIFNDLGLIVIDEQHRFGVGQRKQLIDKGNNPEILAMTATPIPRTLSLTLHGDMDISLIDELPGNRIPITTKVVEPNRLEKVYDFMRQEMKNGRQCFIVYPLIEESEKIDLKAVETGFNTFSKKIFPEFNIGCIHGKMDKIERDNQMLQLANGEMHCLVATTVIEVGIDIPNATVMLIENAERFGLTQLHQLRGRIGRGTHKSYCVLVQNKKTPESEHRLNVMERTLNGFDISDEDLKLRGPGEFFGTKQHGYIKSKLADFVNDGPIIRRSRQRAQSIILTDPQLKQQEHQYIRSEFLVNYQHMLEYINIG